jgi:hypothetical protein
MNLLRRDINITLDRGVFRPSRSGIMAERGRDDVVVSFLGACF